MALIELAYAKQYLRRGTDRSQDRLIQLLIDLVSDRAEVFCDRRFESATYTHERYDGTGTTKLNLKNFPVTALSRISIGTESPMTIINTSSDAATATARVTTTSLVLTIVGGANAGTDTLVLADADKDTLGELDDAIIAVGKDWSATTSSEYEDTPSSELLPCGGWSCLDAQANLYIPSTPITGYELYAQRGEVYYDSGFDVGAQNVIVDYTAGYTTIPDDLRLAVMELLAYQYSVSGHDPLLMSEKIGDYSYKTGGLDGVVVEIPYALMERNLARWKRFYVL